MRIINLRGQNLDYPEPLDTEWADEATNYASAVADVINRISPTTDILDTKVIGLTEDSTWRIIPGLLLNKTNISAANISLIITREGGTVTERANFFLEASFNTNSDEWDMSISNTGHSDIDLDIDSTGQIKFMADPAGSTTFTARYRVTGFAN
jgi:hypothetical protein